MTISDALHNPVLIGSLGLSAGSIFGYFRNIPQRISGLFERFLICSFQVSNAEDEDTYRTVRSWVASLDYAKRTRRLTAIYSDQQWNLTPAPGDHFFWFRGRPVWLHRHRDKPASDLESKLLKFQETITIRVLTRNNGVISDLCESIEDFHRRIQVPEGHFRIFGGEWDSWYERGTRIARPLDSVILPNGDIELVTRDLEWFWSSESWYRSVGVPYRRGWLLHGVPGSGKTSLVSAIAGHYKRDVYMLPLSEPALSDAKLLSLMRKVKKGAIVLLEDVDAAFNERKGEREGITFSGLLNALDGIASPDGVVLFMTTNHPERLDPALIRPGRVDKTMEFSAATEEQLRRLYRRFANGEAPPEFLRSFSGKTVAEAQVHLLQAA